jgi:branched-chain amino acid transport system permease protein
MTLELVIRALINGILLGAIYGVLGMGFSMVYGIVNLPNFAHGAFAMWGMYALIILAKYTGIGPYPGFIFLLLVFFISGLKGVQRERRGSGLYEGLLQIRLRDL